MVIKYLLAISLGIVLLTVAVGWGIYRYHDCLKVGHTKLYCVLSSGK